MMGIWQTAWRENVQDDPDYLLKIIIVRAWEPPRGAPLGALVTDLLATFCRGLALPEINSSVGAWLPLLPVDRFEFMHLYQVLDRLCDMREYATHLLAHYGMRWAQAGKIGAPQFYLHAGTAQECRACYPDRVEPDLINYIFKARPSERHPPVIPY